MATMKQGYYYDEGKKVGYTITVGNLIFQNVSYHSRGQLVSQLMRDGYQVEKINITREKNL